MTNYKLISFLMMVFFFFFLVGVCVGELEGHVLSSNFLLFTFPDFQNKIALKSCV